MRSAPLLQVVPFAIALLALVIRRVLIGAVIVPFLRQRGVVVPVPLHPWRMQRALSDYARLCAEAGQPARWLAEIRWLSVVGLVGMLAFLAAVVVSSR